VVHLVANPAAGGGRVARRRAEAEVLLHLGPPPRHPAPAGSRVGDQMHHSSRPLDPHAGQDTSPAPERPLNRLDGAI
jgi:hypothetical protein